MSALRMLCLFVFMSTVLLTHAPQAMANVEFRRASQGAIDLKGWDGETPLQIHGEWTFFWNELLSPEEFLQRSQRPDFQPGTLEVGKSFSTFDPANISSNSGYGTFVLRLKGLPTRTELGFHALSAYSASRLYFFDANGTGAQTVRSESGRVGTDAASMSPRMQNSAVQSLGTATEQDHFFLIQVSNFHHRKGGLWLPPEMGKPVILQAAKDHEQQISFFFMGMMAFIIFYNISFFSRRLEDKGPLWLALTTTVLLIRSLAYAGSHFEFLGISEAAGFELRWKIFYMTIPMSTIFFMQFVSSYFPAQLTPRVVRLFWVVAIPCMIFIAVTPTRIFSHFVNPISAFGSLMGLVSIYAQARATRAGEKGAVISLVGTVLVFIGSVLDILWSKGYTFLPTNCTGITITLFVVAQSQIVAVRFASAFRKAEHLGRELQTEVEKQTRDIKSILRSIKQGIFTLVQPQGTVGSQYSDHLQDIVGKSHIEGETLERLILDGSRLSADEKSLIDSAVSASLGEDRVAYDANEHCLVRELDYTQPGTEDVRHLELEWTPIMAKDDSVEKILVCVRDVTELRVLRQQADQRGEDLRIIYELVSISQDRFQRFIRTTRDYLEQSRSIILDASRNHTESVKLLFINIHTIKGTARAFQLHAISDVSHEIEQHYNAIRKGETQWDRDELLASLSRVQSILARYEDAGRTKLGWDMDNKMLRLPRGRLLLGLETLQSLHRETWSGADQKALGAVEALLMEYCYARLQDVLRDICAGLSSLARDLEKLPPDVTIAPSPVVLQETGVDLIQSVMTHLLRNSIDHGIEQPEIRQRLGKAAQGGIAIRAQTQGTRLDIEFSDDGAGLDLERIRDMARERGLLSPNVKLSDLQLAHLIFEDGLSTKGEVTRISGRGVGMSAVRSLLESQGGTIEILAPEGPYDRNHMPLIFRLSLPQQLWRLLQSESTVLSTRFVS